MSDIVGKVEDFANKKLDQKAQPGNKVEGAADTDVNNKINDAAGQVGVSEQDQGLMDKVADSKVNSDIPFGNK